MRSLVPALLLFGALVLPADAQEEAGGDTGVSRAFNPAISANALFTGVYASESIEHGHEERGDGEEHADGGEHTDGEEHTDGHVHGPGTDTGMRVQEVEMQLASFVDPYLKADLILAFPGGEGVELEEGYVTSQGLPANLLLRVGRFYTELGRHNRLHAHQFPFLDAPLVSERLLGDEGLAETGLSLSWLSPLPWYLELTGQVLDGQHELFASDDGEDLLYLGHAKGFWELGAASTLELGGTAATGTNAFGEASSLWGADLTWKWRPSRRARYRSFVWQSEYLMARRDEGPATHEEDGFYTLAQYQMRRRWWVQGRWDRFEDDWRASSLLAFVSSEFSSVRLQYNRLHADGEDIDQLMVQLNVTIGSHPAHRY